MPQHDLYSTTLFLNIECKRYWSKWYVRLKRQLICLYAISRNLSENLILELLVRCFQLAQIVKHQQYIRLRYNVVYNLIIKSC